ncbi:hypothetical protein HJC99_01545 [Candidatus Saccharibacteria bacterium]|nr:hypothetical protein [Candidatus Saccharibacteria bacterium]
MDYGSWLASQVPNPNRRSQHYAVQSTFEGSARQVRGELLRRVLVGPMTTAEIEAIDTRAPALAAQLVKEGFLMVAAGCFQMVR